MMTFERRIGLCVKDLMVAGAGVVKNQTEIAGGNIWASVYRVAID